MPKLTRYEVCLQRQAAGAHINCYPTKAARCESLAARGRHSAECGWGAAPGSIARHSALPRRPMGNPIDICLATQEDYEGMTMAQLANFIRRNCKGCKVPTHSTLGRNVLKQDLIDVCLRAKPADCRTTYGQRYSAMDPAKANIRDLGLMLKYRGIEPPVLGRLTTDERLARGPPTPGAHVLTHAERLAVRMRAIIASAPPPPPAPVTVVSTPAGVVISKAEAPKPVVMKEMSREDVRGSATASDAKTGVTTFDAKTKPTPTEPAIPPHVKAAANAAEERAVAAASNGIEDVVMAEAPSEEPKHMQVYATVLGDESDTKHPMSYRRSSYNEHVVVMQKQKAGDRDVIVFDNIVPLEGATHTFAVGDKKLFAASDNGTVKSFAIDSQCFMQLPIRWMRQQSLLPGKENKAGVAVWMRAYEFTNKQLHPPAGLPSDIANEMYISATNVGPKGGNFWQRWMMFVAEYRELSMGQTWTGKDLWNRLYTCQYTNSWTCGGDQFKSQWKSAEGETVTMSGNWGFVSVLSPSQEVTTGDDRVTRLVGIKAFCQYYFRRDEDDNVLRSGDEVQAILAAIGQLNAMCWNNMRQATGHLWTNINADNIMWMYNPSIGPDGSSLSKFRAVIIPGPPAEDQRFVEFVAKDWDLNGENGPMYNDAEVVSTADMLARLTRAMPYITKLEESEPGSGSESE